MRDEFVTHMIKLNEKSRIFVAGHQGLAGSAIVRCLKSNGYQNLIFKTHSELELIDQQAVNAFYENEKPQCVIMAAAKVGGIIANKTYPGEFIYSNLQIQNNLIHGAYQHKVQKLVFLGSSCIYPRESHVPIKETELLTGPLEPTNEWYAIAKIAGIKMCQAYHQQYGCNYISVMPCNLYGPGDNYDLEKSHVLPALIRRFHEAKVKNLNEVELWGTGRPLREFLYSDDLGEAVVFLMEQYDSQEIINVGNGAEISIDKLARKVADCVGYKGRIVWDTSMPDGTPRKMMDSSRIQNMGWFPRTTLERGLLNTYQDYKLSYEK